MSQFFKIAFLALLTIGPSLLWMNIISSKRKNGRMSKKLLCALFVLGAIVIFPVAKVEVMLKAYNPFINNSTPWHFVNDFAFVGLVEEIGKLAVLLLLTINSKHLKNEYDCVICAVAVALGFAAIENVAYVYKADNPFMVATLRAFLCTTSHMYYAIWMGWLYGVFKFKRLEYTAGQATILLCAIMLVPTFLHGTGNCLMGSGLVYLAIVVDAAVLSYSLYLVHTVSKETCATKRYDPLNSTFEPFINERCVF